MLVGGVVAAVGSALHGGELDLDRSEVSLCQGELLDGLGKVYG